MSFAVKPMILNRRSFLSDSVLEAVGRAGCLSRSFGGFLSAFVARILSAAIASALVTALAGCVAAPPAPPVFQQTFQHLPRLALTTLPVFENHYRPPAGPAHIDHLLPQNPARLAQQWVADRLGTQPASRHNPPVLTIRLVDGQVIRSVTPAKSGIFGLVAQNETVFKGILVVEIVYQPPFEAGYELRIEVEATETLVGAISLNDRDAAYFRMLDAMALEFDRQMTREMAKKRLIVN